jgi:hypothetical protein
MAPTLLGGCDDDSVLIMSLPNLCSWVKNVQNYQLGYYTDSAVQGMLDCWVRVTQRMLQTAATQTSSPTWRLGKLCAKPLL